MGISSIDSGGTPDVLENSIRKNLFEKGPAMPRTYNLDQILAERRAKEAADAAAQVNAEDAEARQLREPNTGLDCPEVGHVLGERQCEPGRQTVSGRFKSRLGRRQE